MIQYDTDGVTLFYVDASGNKVAASPMDGAKYSDMDVIFTAQLQAQAENKHAVDMYTEQLKNAQISIDAARPADAPQKPLKHLVSDTGVSTFVPFDPPLPDLIPRPVNTEGQGSTAVPTVDKDAIMYAMITAIYRKFFPAA